MKMNLFASVFFPLLIGALANATVYENKDNLLKIVMHKDGETGKRMLIKVIPADSKAQVFLLRKESKAYDDQWWAEGSFYRLSHIHKGGLWDVIYGDPSKTLRLTILAGATEPSREQLLEEYEQQHYDFTSGARADALKMADLKSKLASQCGAKNLKYVTSGKITQAEDILQGRAYLNALLELCSDEDYKTAIGKIRKIEFVPGQSDYVHAEFSKNQLTFYISKAVMNPKLPMKRKLEDLL